jgi:hypothetical protein
LEFSTYFDAKPLGRRERMHSEEGATLRHRARALAEQVATLRKVKTPTGRMVLACGAGDATPCAWGTSLIQEDEMLCPHAMSRRLDATTPFARETSHVTLDTAFAEEEKTRSREEETRPLQKMSPIQRSKTVDS